MWREVERTIIGKESYEGKDGKTYQRDVNQDKTRRELKRGDIVFLGDSGIGEVYSYVFIKDDDRAKIIAGQTKLWVFDEEGEEDSSPVLAFPITVERMVEKRSVSVNIGPSSTYTVIEWYPEPEEPAVQEGQAAEVGLQTSTIIAPQLRGDSLPPEAGQAIAERQKYSTLPSGLRVTPSIPSGQDPRPPEYYTGSRGSTPPLPASIRTTRSPWDHRPVDYHTGGPGPVGLPPWAQPPKGPIGR